MSTEAAMACDFDEIIDRRNTASVKWERYEGRDIIPLWVADMDFRSPPEILQALHERVDHGVFGYTMPPNELTEAVTASLEADYRWRIDPDWLVWLPGLVTGLNLACRAVGREGDAVITAVPVYPPFMSAPLNSGRALITVPLAEENGRWGFDLDRMEREITPMTRLLLLCNPHNPVGRAFSRDELTRLAEFCQRHDLVICSDEIHAGLVLDGEIRHIPVATLSPTVADRTITLLAPSKTFNIPGLGCSFAVIPEQQLRKRFKQAMAGIVPHVNILGYAAALAAYRDCGAWHRALLHYLRGNRDLVAQAIGEMPGLTVTHVEATYLSWIDVRGAGLDRPSAFFENHGVGLSDGSEFGSPGFVRLNFGCPRPLLLTALERMRTALQNNPPVR